MSEPEPDPRPKARLRLPVSRQRLVEFAVVVLGVLVALGLENLIQEVRFRADARDLERAFVGELTTAVGLSLERQAVTPCLVQQLRVLSERVSAAAGELEATEPGRKSHLILYATPQIYTAPVRLWVSSSFDRALSSEAFKRIPSDRASEYAGLFAQIRDQQELNDAEFLAAMGLAPLAYAQPAMNAEVRADALQQIAILDRYQAKIAVSSAQILEAALSLPVIGEDVRRSLIVGEEDLEGYRSFRSSLGEVYGDCVDLTAMDRLLIPPAT